MKVSIPINSDPGLRKALSEIEEAINRLAVSTVVDLHGRRIGNAGLSVDPGDYVTKRELSAIGVSSPASSSSEAERLDDLEDIVIGALVAGQLLEYNGTDWVNLTLPADKAVLYSANGVLSGGAVLVFDYANGRLGVGVSPAEILQVAGNCRISGVYKVGTVQVLGAQAAAVADATQSQGTVSVSGASASGSDGTAGWANATDKATVVSAISTLSSNCSTLASAINGLRTDIMSVKTQLNDLLAKIRTHGVIAT